MEDGPILEIIGGQIVSGVTECKTNALDHEDMIDFAPGNEAVFEGETDKDVLGSCYKVIKQKSFSKLLIYANFLLRLLS